MASKSVRLSFAASALAIALASPSLQAQELSLAEAQSIAGAAAPQLLAQEAAVRSAREASLSAGELPDPKLLAMLDNWPIQGPDRFSVGADGMTMRRIGLMQEFPREEKRRLRGARAEAEVRREQALLAVSAVNLQRDVAIAWVEAWNAEQQLAALEALAKETALNVTASQAALAGGRGTAADPFGARLAAAQLDDRILEARRLAARAREQLARWIGRDAERTLADPPDFMRVVHDHEKILGELESHPHLAVYGPLQDIAEADVRLADAARRPDWSLEVSYLKRGSAYPDMFAIGVRIDLPILEGRRQAPAWRSRLAAAEQVRSQAEDARRAHLAEVRIMISDWRATRERVQRIQSTQVPLAHERAQAALAAYGGGRGELMPVLEARRGEIETRLGLLQAQLELGRAWAQLNFLVPETAHEEEKP